MKRILLTVCFISALGITSYAQSNPPLTLRDADGSHSQTNASALVFPNGTVSIANGVVTVTIAGAGTVTHTGALATNAVVLGNGTDDIKPLASLGTAGQVLTSNGAGVPPSFQAGGGGTGDVVGPGSATDNAIVRFDTTTGKLVQNSAVTIADTTGDITGGKYNGITFTPVTATFTLIGSTVVTGPSATTTLPGLSLSNTFTAKQIITPAVNTNALATTGYSLTGSNASSLIDLAGTWNTSGSPALIKANVTNTASGAASLLIDLQVGGVSQFSVNPFGGATMAGLTVNGGAGNISLNTSGKVTLGGFSGAAIVVDPVALNQWHAHPNDLMLDTVGKVQIGDPAVGSGNATRVEINDSGLYIKLVEVSGLISIGDTDLIATSTVFATDTVNQKFTFTNGVMALGTATPDATALLTMSSTTLGFLPPQMTTTQRDAIVSPTEGLTIFNLTTHQPNYWTGSAWSAGVGAPYTDAVAIIKGSADTTKLLRFEVDGFTTGTTRVITPPNADTILPIATQQLTFAGPTAARTITLPDAAFTAARTDAANTFTGVQTMTTPSFTTGFTIGGAATSRKLIAGNGTNFVPSTETWAVPGTSGNVLTSDGTNWTSAAPAGGGITIGTTAITSGTSTRLLFNLSGVVSEDADLTFVTDTLTATKLAAPTSVTSPLITNAGTISITTTASNGDLNLTLNGSGNVISNRSIITSVGGQAFIAGTDNSNYNIGLSGGSSGQLRGQSQSIFGWTNDTNGNATIDIAMGRNAAGVGEVNNGTLGTFRDWKVRTLISDSTVRLKGFTVATLPAGTQGDTAFVTDALVPTFLATIVGGGTVVTPVFFNGTNWVGY